MYAITMIKVNLDNLPFKKQKGLDRFTQIHIHTHTHTQTHTHMQ